MVSEKITQTDCFYSNAHTIRMNAVVYGYALHVYGSICSTKINVMNRYELICNELNYFAFSAFLSNIFYEA